MRVGLIGCSKTKLAEAAPARELYSSSLFRLARAWMESRFDHWGILSAKHGLVLPDQIIDPYDLAISSFSLAEKKEWALRVSGQLTARWGEGAIYTVLAGGDYRSYLSGFVCVEDVIECWTQWRRDRGMTGRQASIGIGVLKSLLKQNTPYY